MNDKFCQKRIAKSLQISNRIESWLGTKGRKRERLMHKKHIKTFNKSHPNDNHNAKVSVGANNWNHYTIFALKNYTSTGSQQEKSNRAKMEKFCGNCNGISDSNREEVFCYLTLCCFIPSRNQSHHLHPPPLDHLRICFEMNGKIIQTVFQTPK